MAKCNYTWDLKLADSAGTSYYDLGDMLMCILGNVWDIVKVILAGILIILMSMLILKTIRNRENPKVLPELGKNWMFLFLLIIVVIGGAGTFLNILFGFLNLPDIQYWLDRVNELFETL